MYPHSSSRSRSLIAIHSRQPRRLLIVCMVTPRSLAIGVSERLAPSPTVRKICFSKFNRRIRDHILPIRATTPKCFAAVTFALSTAALVFEPM